MEWWQIILIALGCIIGGIVIAVLLGYLSYSIKRYWNGWSFKKRTMTLLPEEQRPELNSIVKETNRKEAIRMVPLLSRQSIIVLAIGLAIGIGLGLGYWSISPVNAELKLGWPPINGAGTAESDTFYESTTPIVVSDSSATYIDMKARSRQAEYWANKLDSPLFFEYLSQELAKQAPQYSHAPDELDQMIWARFDGSSPEFQLKVTSQSEEEALFLASIIPEVFKTYLINEERNAYLQDYEDTQRRFDIVVVFFLFS